MAQMTPRSDLTGDRAAQGGLIQVPPAAMPRLPPRQKGPRPTYKYGVASQPKSSKFGQASAGRPNSQGAAHPAGAKGRKALHGAVGPQSDSTAKPALQKVTSPPAGPSQR
ncbi:hypothetical protein NDU88_006416 [Pleurodeles waltl]|uniref:Uncharacterized protein n=1 Tax=Pleurodeles waltl TaxID=8319 RepID=A0AAV7RLW6_PLEWA|nr:hypothetical protein NDU88_006416 [Pleurodeles waltl]